MLFFLKKHESLLLEFAICHCQSLHCDALWLALGESLLLGARRAVEHISSDRAVAIGRDSSLKGPKRGWQYGTLHSPPRAGPNVKTPTGRASEGLGGRQITKCSTSHTSSVATLLHSKHSRRAR